MRDLEKRTISRAVIIAIILSGICLLLGFTKVFFGILVGTLGSILNFKLLARSIARFDVKTNRLNTSFYFFLNYLIRYGIMGFILWISLQYKGVHFFIGVILGLLMIRAGIFYNAFIIKGQAGVR
jgi:hypothetical protein